MNERLKEFMKKTNGKRLWQFILILIVGALLMYLSGFMDSGGKNETASFIKTPAIKNPTEPKETAAGEQRSYEEALEKRLEDTLSTVQGVGRVSVVLTLSYKGEIALAEDTTTETSKSGDLSITDEATGRNSVTERKEIRHVIVTGKDGTMQPIIIKQTEPKIEGVIIVAEGGDNAAVKASLTKAAEAVLNLPAHKIEVLAMKKVR